MVGMYSRKLYVKLALVFMSLTLQPAHASLFGPKSYDECVLDSMKGVTSDLAARAIIMSCRNRFPYPKNASVDIPQNVLTQISGNGGAQYDGFGGSLYNGNRDWMVTEVVIGIVPLKNGGQDISRVKRLNVQSEIPSLTERKFHVPFTYVQGEKLDWFIVSAKGYKKQN